MATPSITTSSPVSTAPAAEALLPLPASADPLPPVAPALESLPAPADEGTGNSLAIAGLLGLVALGGAGIYAATRRRRPLNEDDVAYTTVQAEELPPENPPVQSATQPGAFSAMAATSAAAPFQRSEPVVSQPLAAATHADPDDRQAVLDSMVDAEPDEANPFTARKARMRRARLILQGREARGEPLAETQHKIDWNQYTPSRTGNLVDA